MKRIVAMLVLLVLFLSMVPAAHAYEAPVTSANKDEHFYVNAQRWNDPITSTLEVTKDGYTRVEYVGDRLIAEKYDRNFRFVSGQEIQLELPIFGGVYLGEDCNVVVLGQENFEEDDTKEVFRIIRYSKDWVREGSAGIYGANTTIPFDAGSLRFARSGDILYIRTCHEMYTTSDGLNHQANVMISVRISDMTVTDQLTKTWNQSYGYVSHSFNQFVLVDGSTLLAVDHGDYYPRSVVLFKYRNPAGQETFYSRVSYVNALNIVNSSYHYNDTGVSVGGFEASSDHYLIAGCSADQTEVVDLMEAHRNIFVTATPKDNFTDEGTTLRWLTSFREEDNVEVSPPHLVKLSANRFFLIWTENGRIRYCTLNGKGEQEGQTRSMEGDLSDCVPVVDNGKVIWYVTEYSAPVFYVVDPDAPEHTHSYENGFCTDCDACEPAVLKNGVYEISNAGQLYWFAELVNSGEYAANGRLMADIRVNEKVLKEDGTLSSGGFRAWTPMGDSQGRYAGTFDGNFKTISGLYFSNASMDYVALFGCLGQHGLVKNLAVLDSYFRGENYVGAIAGVNYGTIDSCYSRASLAGSRYVGGIAGSVDGGFDNELESVYGGTVKNCYSMSYVQGSAFTGGIAGFVMNTVSQVAGKGTILDCFFLTGRAAAGNPDGKAATAAEFASGEVAYYLGDPFGQTIGTDPAPVFGGAKVYRNQTGGCNESSFTYVFSNTAAEAVTTHEMVDATCEKAAYCLRCGMIQGKPLGHNYETKVFEATCLEGGYSESRCTNCGDFYIHDETGPVDHSYENGTCIWCGDMINIVEWVAANATLTGSIDLNFSAVLSDNLVKDSTFVRFTCAGKVVDVPMADAAVSVKNGQTRYRFGYKVYAKEMTETVTAQVMTPNGPVGEAKSYSVAQYCNALMGATKDAKIIAVCKAMLNYGAAAQKQFSYNLDNLANATLSEADKVVAKPDASRYAYKIVGTGDGIKATSAKLTLDADVAIRVTFQITGGKDVSAYKFLIDGEETDPIPTGDRYYIELDGIAASKFDDTHIFSVGDLAVHYSVLSYVHMVHSSNSPENLVNLINALYAYYAATEAYVDPSSSKEPANPPADVQFRLVKDYIEMEAGATALIEATYSGASGVPAWSSESPSVATVDGTGRITAHREGVAVITGSYGGKTLRCVVQVYPKTEEPTEPDHGPAVSVWKSGNNGSWDVGCVGNYLSFNAGGRTADGVNMGVTASSSNTGVATVSVSANGSSSLVKVSFNGSGSTTITLTSSDGNASTSFTINVTNYSAQNASTPEAFAAAVNYVVGANGASVTTSGAYTVLSLSDAQLTWDEAVGQGQYIAHRAYTSGAKCGGCTYQGVDPDSGEHVFYLYAS